MIGNILGLIALALGWRRSIWTWPVQFLSGVVLVGAYVSAHLTGSVGKQLVVIGRRRLWGWRQWNRGRQQAAGRLHRRPRSPPGASAACLLGAAAVGTLAVGACSSRAYPTLSWNPWPDAYIFVGTLVAMYAQARGMVEFWFAWLLVDLVGVPLNFASGSPSPASSTSSTSRSSCGACATGGCAPARTRGPSWKERPA